MSRYCCITPCPNTKAEAERIDDLAREQEHVWEIERERAGRMTLADAQKLAASLGLHARQDFTCKRSPKTHKATHIKVSCQLWVAKRYSIPGFGTGQSLDHGVYADTFEEAFRLRRLKDIAYPNTRAKVPASLRGATC